MLRLADINRVDVLIKKYNIISLKSNFITDYESKEIEYSELKYLLECGMILASSNKVENKQRILNIATLVAELTNDSRLLVICRNLLNRIKNFPTRQVIEKKNVDVKYIVPPVENIREIYGEINNTINILDKQYVITDIQANIYKLFEKYKDISLSAPTSIGKTFIITRLIIKELISTSKNIVYIVPTRALINQVMNEIEDELKKLEIRENYFVQITSDTTDIDGNKKGIFILTQERFYQLCNLKNIEIGTLVIDEAQNIMENARGILLEYSIRYAKTIWPTIRIIFISPFIENPQILLDKFRLEENSNAYQEKQLSVRQNIIKLEQLPRGYRARYKEEIIINKLPINRSNGVAKTITSAYVNFNNGRNSIMYCNRADNAIRLCKELSKLNIFEESTDEEIVEFADFVETFIHKNYLLGRYIRKGIVFHYGTLPGFIRTGIEDLASRGKFSVIACTPTLLQGVNIPAQNIYIFNPRKGKVKLTNLDFWNLVGRAGRMNFDLSGNIILIENERWDDIDQYDQRNIELQCATKLNTELSEVLKEAILDGTIVDETIEKEQQTTVEYLESAMIFDHLVDHQDNVEVVYTNKEEQEKVEEKINNIIENFEAPKSLLISLLGIRHRYISDLWEVFKRNDYRIEKYILLHPMGKKRMKNNNEYSEFDERYSRTIQLIHKHLMDDNLYEWDNPSWLIGVSKAWIRERPLKELLFWGFNEFNNPDRVTSVVNKQTKFLNDAIRYKLVKGMYAYQEVLKEYLIQTQRPLLAEKIVNMPTFLEFGASRPTTLDLMKMGLNRELAIELVSNYDLDEKNLVYSLKGLNLEEGKLNAYALVKLKQFISGL